MKWNKSKNLGDCGVSALASLMNISYKKAYNTIWPEKKPKGSHGTTTQQIATAARTLGAKTPFSRLRRVKNWSTIPPNSLVCVRFKYQRRNWHWIAWDGKHAFCNIDGKLKPEKAEFSLYSYFPIIKKTKNK